MVYTGLLQSQPPLSKNVPDIRFDIFNDEDFHQTAGTMRKEHSAMNLESMSGPTMESSLPKSHSVSYLPSVVDSVLNETAEVEDARRKKMEGNEMNELNENGGKSKKSKKEGNGLNKMNEMNEMNEMNGLNGLNGAKVSSELNESKMSSELNETYETNDWNDSDDSGSYCSSCSSDSEDDDYSDSDDDYSESEFYEEDDDYIYEDNDEYDDDDDDEEAKGFYYGSSQQDFSYPDSDDFIHSDSDSNSDSNSGSNTDSEIDRTPSSHRTFTSIPSPPDFSPSHRSSPMIDFVFEPDLKADEASRPFNSMFPSNRDVLDGLPDLQSSISPVTPIPLDDDLLPPLRVRDYSRIVEQLSVEYALDPQFRRLHNELQARVPSLFYWCVVADSVVDCQTPGWWAKRYPFSPRFYPDSA